MTVPLTHAELTWPLARLDRAVRGRIWLAQALMLGENVWYAARSAIAAGVVFAIAGLFGLPQALPGVLRVTLLLALLCWTGWCLYHKRLALWPSHRAAVRRVEQTSALPHGVLAALADTPATPKSLEAQALWAVARARLHARAVNLRWPRPRLDVEASDPHGLAPMLLIAAVLGVLISSKPVSQRLAAAFSPWPTSLDGMELTAWVRPPAYTGLPPRQVDIPVGGSTEIDAPANSRLILTVTGGDRHFRLIGPGLDVQAPVQDRLAEFNVPLVRGTYRLRVGALRPVAAFRTRITRDGAPTIAFDGKIRVSLTQALDFKYTAQDDYGIVQLFLATIKGDTSLAVPLADPASGTKISGKAFKDMTPSRFAGERVQLRLVARDASGNFGVSTPVTLTLPERVFTHPVARQIILARKQVWADPVNLQPPATRLDALSRDPGSFKNDLTIFSALRRSVWRLRSKQAWTEIAPITDFLWETALDVEAQKTGKDMAALRQKFEQLMSQMQNSGTNAGARQKLMDQMMQEMAQYMASKAMAPDSGGGMMDEMGQQMSSQLLDQLLQELQERMAAGDEAGARRAMEALQGLLENARFSSTPGGSGGTGSSNALMQALGKAIQQQQQLMTQSRAAGAEEGQSGAPSDQLQAIARTQGDLAGQMQRTQQMARGAGSSPQALGKAAAAMRAAEQALKRGDVPGATRAQAEALNNLASARQEIAQSLKQGDGTGQGQLPPGADPLGRFNGGANGPELPLPTAAERQRLQQIRTLLEERAADPTRPEAERAYILRLLRRF